LFFKFLSTILYLLHIKFKILSTYPKILGQILIGIVLNQQSFPSKLNPSMVVPAYNLSTWKGETGGKSSSSSDWAA
jgi:hypothetical protein